MEFIQKLKQVIIVILKKGWPLLFAGLFAKLTQLCFKKMVTGVNYQTYLLAFLLSFSLSFIFCIIFFYRLRESDPVAPAVAPPSSLTVPDVDPPSYHSKDQLGPD